MNDNIIINKENYVERNKDELIVESLNDLKLQLVAMAYETYGVEMPEKLKNQLKYKNYDSNVYPSPSSTNDSILYGIIKYDKSMQEMEDSSNNLVSIGTFMPNFNGWDIHKALLAMNDRRLVTPKSRGKCAMAVRSFIEAGGMSTVGRPASAYKYTEYLPTKGFRHVAKLKGRESQNAFHPQPGDISVMSHGKHGHICMWSGNQWVSDFPQSNMWPYKGEGTCDIFRFYEA